MPNLDESAQGNAPDTLQEYTFGAQEGNGPQGTELERRLKTHVAILQQLAQQPDARHALAVLARELVIATRPGSCAAAYLWDADSETLQHYASYGSIDGFAPHTTSTDPSQVLGAAVLQNLAPIVLTQDEFHAHLSTLGAEPPTTAPTSVLILPLEHDQVALGLVQLYVFDHDNALATAEIDAALHILRLAASSLQNAVQYEQSKRKEQEAVGMNRVLQTINATLDLDTILKTIRRSVSNILRFDFTFIQLIDRDKHLLKAYTVHGNRISGEQQEQFKRLTIPLATDDASISLQVIRQRQSLQLNDVQGDDSLLPYDKRLHELLPFRSLVAYPLIVHQEAIGVISFAAQQGFNISRRQSDALERYVLQIANAIYNAFLFEESRQAQQELMIKNIAVQSQSEEIRAQNEALSAQSLSIMQQTRELESLVKIMQVINQEFELEKILEMLVEEGLLLINGAERGTFLVFDTGTRTFRYIAYKGYTDAQLKEIQLSWKDALARYSREQDMLMSGVYAISPRRSELPPSSVLSHLPLPESMLAMTMTVKGAIVGFLIFDNFTSPDAFTESDLHKLKRFHEHAATAFFKARFVRKIQQQKSELEGAYQKISDSISYARRILEAILPRTRDIIATFRESFVLFRPKEIVSGDFYWFSRRSTHVIFAAVDCTGHGIPGAFMSVLGNTLLNQIVNERDITDPATILDELSRNVKQMLGQFDAESESFDGMDVALCSYDIERHELAFAGANRPLYFVSDGQIVEIKGNKQPVGGSQLQDAEGFVTNTMPLKQGDTVYITTDGYTDQFSGTLKRRKFMNVRLKELLLKIQKQNMPQQSAMLEEAIIQWRGRTAQLDDILVIGIRFGKPGDVVLKPA